MDLFRKQPELKIRSQFVINIYNFFVAKPNIYFEILNRYFYSHYDLNYEIGLIRKCIDKSTYSIDFSTFSENLSKQWTLTKEIFDVYVKQVYFNKDVLSYIDNEEKKNKAQNYLTDVTIRLTFVSLLYSIFKDPYFDIDHSIFFNFDFKKDYTDTTKLKKLLQDLKIEADNETIDSFLFATNIFFDFVIKQLDYYYQNTDIVFSRNIKPSFNNIIKKCNIESDEEDVTIDVVNVDPNYYYYERDRDTPKILSTIFYRKEIDESYIQTKFDDVVRNIDNPSPDIAFEIINTILREYFTLSSVNISDYIFNPKAVALNFYQLFQNDNTKIFRFVIQPLFYSITKFINILEIIIKYTEQNSNYSEYTIYFQKIFVILDAIINTTLYPIKQNCNQEDFTEIQDSLNILLLNNIEFDSIPFYKKDKKYFIALQLKDSDKITDEYSFLFFVKDDIIKQYYVDKNTSLYDVASFINSNLGIDTTIINNELLLVDSCNLRIYHYDYNTYYLSEPFYVRLQLFDDQKYFEESIHKLDIRVDRTELQVLLPIKNDRMFDFYQIPITEQNYSVTSRMRIIIKYFNSNNSVTEVVSSSDNIVSSLVYKISYLVAKINEQIHYDDFILYFQDGYYYVGTTRNLESIVLEIDGKQYNCIVSFNNIYNFDDNNGYKVDIFSNSLDTILQSSLKIDNYFFDKFSDISKLYSINKNKVYCVPVIDNSTVKFGIYGDVLIDNSQRPTETVSELNVNNNRSYNIYLFRPYVSEYLLRDSDSSVPSNEDIHYVEKKYVDLIKNTIQFEQDYRLIYVTKLDQYYKVHININLQKALDEIVKHNHSYVFFKNDSTYFSYIDFDILCYHSDTNSFQTGDVYFELTTDVLNNTQTEGFNHIIFFSKPIDPSSTISGEIVIDGEYRLEYSGTIENIVNQINSRNTMLIKADFDGKYFMLIFTSTRSDVLSISRSPLIDLLDLDNVYVISSDNFSKFVEKFRLSDEKQGLKNYSLQYLKSLIECDFNTIQSDYRTDLDSVSSKDFTFNDDNLSIDSTIIDNLTDLSLIYQRILDKNYYITSFVKYVPDTDDSNSNNQHKQLSLQGSANKINKFVKDGFITKSNKNNSTMSHIIDPIKKDPDSSANSFQYSLVDFLNKKIKGDENETLSKTNQKSKIVQYHELITDSESDYIQYGIFNKIDYSIIDVISNLLKIKIEFNNIDDVSGVISGLKMDILEKNDKNQSLGLFDYYLHNIIESTLKNPFSRKSYFDLKQIINRFIESSISYEDLPSINNSLYISLNSDIRKINTINSIYNKIDISELIKSIYKQTKYNSIIDLQTLNLSNIVTNSLNFDVFYLLRLYIRNSMMNIEDIINRTVDIINSLKYTFGQINQQKSSQSNNAVTDIIQSEADNRIDESLNSMTSTISSKINGGGGGNNKNRLNSNKTSSSNPNSLLIAEQTPSSINVYEINSSGILSSDAILKSCSLGITKQHQKEDTKPDIKGLVQYSKQWGNTILHYRNSVSKMCNNLIADCRRAEQIVPSKAVGSSSRVATFLSNLQNGILQDISWVLNSAIV